jgi:uncharacterized protein involved in tellurium resistance
MEIRSKLQLKSKGETVNLPTVKQLKVTLSWKSSVDLDLMAFGTKKDGSTFGVYSNEISNDIKTMGNLNEFPFMSLSGDAGVGAVGGDNEEVLKIMKLDDVATLKLIALNYTDASAKNSEASFAAYDGIVTVMDENGDAFEVPLTATEKGTAAVIATIDNSSAMGATLKRDDQVLSFVNFIETVPGAREALV